MHTLCGRDIRGLHWIVDMRSLSYRIVIASWRSVMHTLCERYLLCYGRVRVYIVRGGDVC